MPGEVKHRSYAWKGQPADFEAAIAQSMLWRAGELMQRQIGGSASYELEGARWRIEWIHLADPVGVRLDVYAPENVSEAAIDEEAAALVAQSVGSSFDATGARPAELSNMQSQAIEQTNSGASSLEQARRGSTVAIIAGGALVVGSGALLAMKRKSRAWSSVGLGGLVVGGALIAGGAALWAVFR